MAHPLIYVFISLIIYYMDELVYYALTRQIVYLRNCFLEFPNEIFTSILSSAVHRIVCVYTWPNHSESKVSTRMAG